MNKQALAEEIHNKVGCTKTDAQEMVETVVSSITEALKRKEDVSIAGLGTFSVRHRAAREARNPRTGEAIQVPAMHVPKFKAAKGLKDAVK